MNAAVNHIMQTVNWKERTLEGWLRHLVHGVMLAQITA